jgi:hypothetical protein
MTDAHPSSARAVSFGGPLTSHRPDEPKDLPGGLTEVSLLARFPNYEIQFNGVDGLRTHISLRASQSEFPERYVVQHA